MVEWYENCSLISHESNIHNSLIINLLKKGRKEEISIGELAGAI